MFFSFPLTLLYCSVMVDKLIDVLLLFLWCIHAARFISCSFCMISACVYNKLFLYISVPPFYYFAFKTTELLEFTSFIKRTIFWQKLTIFADSFTHFSHLQSFQLLLCELQSRQPLQLPTGSASAKAACYVSLVTGLCCSVFYRM